MEVSLPVIGCCVYIPGDNRVARVVEHLGNDRIRVDFGHKQPPQILEGGAWRCGFMPGFIVQDVPLSAARSTLGIGTVVARREIAAREQVAVQLHSTGQTIWFPYERLRRIMGPRLQYILGQQRDDQAAERTSLNLMANALRTWNQATGALERLDVDPLPHQITLVHRIINSDNINWLIGDDVGLGKTIEVGLLLGALERQRNLRRILIIVPSGLTRQWKEEMKQKFDRDFFIYGRDFEIEGAHEWSTYDRVIASLDLVKPRNSEDGPDSESRFGLLLAAATWDIVIFDEAHRLSRDDAGRTTLRYRLAEELRKRTDSLILLTGTPHQGDVGKFQNLLRLVRPELEAAIETIDENPEIVSELVLRNRKIDAVDAEGNFIFHGLLVRRVEIFRGDDAASLDQLLWNYLRQGYEAGDELGGKAGRAIGFVMTIYRKLASSSIAALRVAMERRRARLLGNVVPGAVSIAADNGDLSAMDIGDGEDDLDAVEPPDPAKAFFEEELGLVDQIIEQARRCEFADFKFSALRKVLKELHNDGEKLLIFTEYRATQADLAQRIHRVTGRAPALIYGGMTVDERRLAIDAFESDADILISTEAGGEGLNLQRNCHVMVNYDLPWNPARLNQRMGRLYRYGQTEKVVVLNFVSKDSIDSDIMSGVLERLEAVVRQMAPVSAEFDERYQAEVLGDLLDRIDINDLLEEARNGHVERSAERIDQAIAKARDAKRLQDDLLARLSPLEDGGWKRLGAFTTEHLARFITRSCALLNISVAVNEATPERFDLRLPEEMRGSFPEFGNRYVIEARTSRGDGGRASSRILLDFSSSFVRQLVLWVTDPEFGGGFGVLSIPLPGAPTLLAEIVHYQSDQGDDRGTDLIVGAKFENGLVEIANAVIRPLFDSVQATRAVTAEIDQTARNELLNAVFDRVELAVAENCTPFRHPKGLFPLAILE